MTHLTLPFHKKHHWLLIPIIIFTLAFISFSTAQAQTAGQIQGTVFLDNDASGARQANAALFTFEDGIQGVTVTAYDADGNAIATDTTDENGDYSLLGLNSDEEYRVEFTLPTNLSFLRPGPALNANGETTTQFINTGTTGITDADVAFIYPVQFCQSNAFLATPCFVNGNALEAPLPGTNPSGDEGALVTFPAGEASTDGTTQTTPLYVADVGGATPSTDGIGSTWGLGYQKSTSTLFAAAMQKRHVSYGPEGPGAIYLLPVNPENGIPIRPLEDQDYDVIDVTNFGVPVGSGPFHSFITGVDQNQFNQPNQDLAAFSLVGKRGLGDIEVSDDDRFLWVINLFNRTLYKINIEDLDNPSLVTSRAVTLPSLPSNEQCNSADDVWPWAVSEYQGRVYVGVVCTAEASQDQDDLRAYVLSSDVDLSTAFVNEINFPLNYTRGSAASAIGAQWLPWVNRPHLLGDINTSGTDPVLELQFDKAHVYPQPILSDIEFDERGNMILGFMDRNGHQSGNANQSGGLDNNDAGTPYDDRIAIVDKDTPFGPGNVVQLTPQQFDNTPTLTVDNNLSPNCDIEDCLFEGISAGDILNVCNTSGSIFATPTFILEGGAGCPGGPAEGSEFFDQDDFQTAHDEITLGGLIHIWGTGQIATTAFDPINEDPTGRPNIRTNGIVYFGQDNGDRDPSPTAGYLIVESDALDTVGSFGKAAGLGDLDSLCVGPPLEIGNFVWEDSNGDGVQDPGEPRIGNVVVSLYIDTDGDGTVDTEVATTSTSGNGEYLFNSATVSAFLGGTTPTAGVHFQDLNGDGNYNPNTEPFGVLPFSTYEVRVEAASNFATSGPLENFFATTSNSTTSNGDDEINDSDGVVPTASAFVSTSNVSTIQLTTEYSGSNDHSFDFGFVQDDPPSNGGGGGGDDDDDSDDDPDPSDPDDPEPSGVLPSIAGTRDWGDLPPSFNTLSSVGGPNHTIDPNIFLGDTVDPEADGQPNDPATGDGEDEDGVTIPDLIPNTTVPITIRATNLTGSPGYVQGWIDLDGSGTFDPGEQIATDLLIPAGTTNGTFVVNVSVPTNTPQDVPIYSRFRISTEAGLSFGGPAPDGEVEDYVIGFLQAGVLPNTGGSAPPLRIGLITILGLMTAILLGGFVMKRYVRAY